MIWTTMSYSGTSDLVKVSCNMNFDTYCFILKLNLNDFAFPSVGGTFYFN